MKALNQALRLQHGLPLLDIGLERVDRPMMMERKRFPDRRI
jgi:hypothetical protein